jgi:hypothetical protein
MLPLKDLNSLFIHAFSGYSSSIDIVHKISGMILEEFRGQYGCATVGEVLERDGKYMLENMMVRRAKMNGG